jgi:hypothetical protein
MGIIWLKAGIWDLRGIMRGSGKGRCPVSLRKGDAKHMVVKCPEPRKWSEFVASKWLNVNEDTAHRKIISCTNVTKLKTTGKYLCKTRCKWETDVGGNTITPPPH